MLIVYISSTDRSALLPRGQGKARSILRGHFSAGIRAYSPSRTHRHTTDRRSLLAFSLQQAPFLARPPHDPLPSSADWPAWYGTFWLKYPEHPTVIDANFGVLFEYRARFRVIMAQYCREVYTNPGTSAFSIRDAYFYRSRLLDWLRSLPPPLQTGSIVLPAQLQLQ